MQLHIGLAKIKINAFHKDVGMMGYGRPHNTIKGEATPLFSRAVVIQNAKQQFVIFAVAELCFITMAVKHAVIEKLQKKFPQKNIETSKLLLSSTHTHSGPGGISHYPLYNFTTSGFRPAVFNSVVDAIFESIVAAFQDLKPRQLTYGETTVPQDVPIAFNRSMKAYVQNPEHKNVKINDHASSLDRTMRAFLIKNNDGTDAGLIHLFGVHGTSISSVNSLIHYDNKGVAAELWESTHPGSVALFAQAAAGDISPNFIWDKKINRMRGPHQDQYKNATHNGELQFEHAKKITFQKPISTNDLKTSLNFINMSFLAAPPAHGIAFSRGSTDGFAVASGISKALGCVATLVRALKLQFSASKNKAFYQAHGNKKILLDHRDGSILGIPLPIIKKFPYFPDTVVQEIIRQARLDALDTLPWVPPIVPIQLIELGEFVIIGMPGEITTTASNRLVQAIQNFYPNKTVLMWSYANAYMGYVTTPEEYDVQCYEGGHTVYGRNTLPAFISGFLELSQEKFSVWEPITFSGKELKLRSVYG